jgi:hypothetical protein
LTAANVLLYALKQIEGNMVRTANRISPEEKSLTRMIAGATRKLDTDLNLTTLQAIDKLQRLDSQYRERWYGHPWLILADKFTLKADMPVAAMLAEIEKHGPPVGIVGVAAVTSVRDSVFAMHFRADSKSRKIVEESAQVAQRYLDEATKIAQQMAEESLEAAIRAHGGQK